MPALQTIQQRLADKEDVITLIRIGRFLDGKSYEITFIDDKKDICKVLIFPDASSPEVLTAKLLELDEFLSMVVEGWE